MRKCNLNDRQRRIVRKLVEVHRDGYEDDFEWFEELGSQPAIQFVVGNFIENMTGGNVQGAAGSGISMSQHAQSQESKTGFGNVLAVISSDSNTIAWYGCRRIGNRNFRTSPLRRISIDGPSRPDSARFRFYRERQTILQALIDETNARVSPPVIAILVRGILFSAADPTDLSRLRLIEEFREIQEKLKIAKMRDRFKLELPQLALRPADISQALLDMQPEIVHFSGHGTAVGELLFEDRLGYARPVQPEGLAALFEQFSDHVDCVVLNACYSESQARAIAKHVPYVVGMNKDIGDSAAVAFSVGFYQALGAGRIVEDAYKLGCVQVQLHSIPEHSTPVLTKRDVVT